MYNYKGVATIKVSTKSPTFGNITFEKDITILGRNLVLPNYHFVLSATHDDWDTGMVFTVFISDIIPDYETKEEAREDDTEYLLSIPQDNLATVQMTFPMMGKQGDATVSFSLWR